MCFICEIEERHVMFHRFKCSLPLFSPSVDRQVAHARWHPQSLLEMQDPEVDKNKDYGVRLSLNPSSISSSWVTVGGS